MTKETAIPSDLYDEIEVEARLQMKNYKLTVTKPYFEFKHNGKTYGCQPLREGKYLSRKLQISIPG